ncbi:MAG TPA: chemotaxis protein CheW [Blastocatellia bacterium]|nr:chemotaxis protein CheW [Blastocatellia bacterium]
MIDENIWSELELPDLPNGGQSDSQLFNPGAAVNAADDVAISEPENSPSPGSDTPESQTFSAMRLEDVVAQIDREVTENALPEAPTAASADKAEAAEEKQKHILFSLSGARYAMPLSQVLEISRVPKLMPLPHVPDWLLGVTNLRGDIISVIDLHLFLGLTAETRREPGRMCVVRAERQDLVTGLMVDRVEGLASLKGDSVGWTTAPLEGNISQHMRGITEHEGHLLRILNLDSLLTSLDLGA